MQLENTRKALEEFKKYVIKQSRSNLTRTKKNASKELYNSIDGNIKVMKNSIYMDFVMEEYGLYQDKGVSGVKKKYDTPYKYTNKMPPPSKLDKWIIRRGLAPRDLKGRFKKRSIDKVGFQKSLAYLIARKIFFQGIKPSLFFTKPFEAGFKRLPDELIEKYGLDLEEFLAYTLKADRLK